MRAIIAALPREVAGLVKGWERRELARRVFVYRKGAAVVACAGMGAGRVTLAVKAALAEGGTELMSAGLAGGCDPAMRVGDVVRAGVVVDVRTGERFIDRRFEQVLVTGASVADVAEKSRLWSGYGAAAVDMEAATVARLAEGQGVGFQALKVISDDAEFEMDGLNRFGTPDGQFREAAFAAYAIVRPALWGKLGQLAGNSKRALTVLTAEMTSFLAESV
jgi:adenosylhomocysteine nucleosidase